MSSTNQFGPGDVTNPRPPESEYGRADFAVLTFMTTIDAENTRETRVFDIDQEPLDEPGYLLIQTRGVESLAHRLELNGRSLPHEDLVPSGGRDNYLLWLDPIPAGYLVRGSNELTIRREQGDTGSIGIGPLDNFDVGVVVVHWREQGFMLPP